MRITGPAASHRTARPAACATDPGDLRRSRRPVPPGRAHPVRNRRGDVGGSGAADLPRYRWNDTTGTLTRCADRWRCPGTMLMSRPELTCSTLRMIEVSSRVQPTQSTWRSPNFERSGKPRVMVPTQNVDYQTAPPARTTWWRSAGNLQPSAYASNAAAGGLPRIAGMQSPSPACPTWWRPDASERGAVRRGAACPSCCASRHALPDVALTWCSGRHHQRLPTSRAGSLARRVSATT